MKPLLLVLTALLLVPPPASAQTRYTWNGGAGAWTDDARWTPVGVPADTDTAVVASGTATLTGNTTVAGFHLPGLGAIDGDADLTVTDAMVSSGGGAGFVALRGTGTVTIAPGATLLLTGPGNRQLSAGRTLVNAGTLTWEMTGEIRGTGRIVNEGEMVISVDMPEPGRLCFQSHDDAIKNGPTGLIRRTGTGEAQVNCRFSNDGLVRVEQGALDLQGWHPTGGDDTGPYDVWEDGTLIFSGGIRTMSESSSVTGAGTVEVRGGTTTLAGAYDVPTTRMPLSPFYGRFDFHADATTATLSHDRHDIGGDGTLTITESYNWTGGNLSGAGMLVVVPGATLSITGPAAKRLEHGWTLQHEGTGTWAATIGSNFGGGTIHNAGSLTLNDDAAANSNRVTNTGDLTKIGAGQVILTSFGGPSFSNFGVVTVAEGTLTVRAAAPDTPDSGTYSVAEGATLNLASVSRTLGPDAVIEGAGTFSYESRPVTNHGTLRPGLSPGLLTFDGNYPAQQPDGVLEVELGGYAPGTEHDQLAITGTAALGGTLRVALLDDFVPQEGDHFTVLAAGTVTGDFAALDLPVGVEASVETTDTTVVLVIGQVTVANEDGGEALPTAFALHAAYPNPFTTEAVLRYDVPSPARVRLALYDVLGREVAVLEDAERAAGTHAAQFDGRGLASGIYLVRMTAEGFSQTHRLTLVR